MASIHDVAKAAGVSAITVSRVMRNGDHVRPETRERVLRAAGDLGYVPNAVARSLKQARSGLLALVNTDMQSPFFDTVARGAEAAAQAAGMAIVIGNSDDDTALEAKYLRIMAEHRVDGIVLVPTPRTTAADIPTLPARVPLVLLDWRPAGLAADLVCCDTTSGTRALCDHLFALGHRRIAIAGGLPHSPTWRNRVVGYLAAQRAAGIPEAADLVLHGNYRASSGADAIRTLMAARDRPDAVIAASAQVLYGMLEELAVLGLTIPDDVSVSCVDDPALPAFFRPRFTYVEQPGDAMGAAAVEVILARLDSGALTGPPVERVFPANMRVGESCRERPLAVAGGGRAARPVGDG